MKVLLAQMNSSVGDFEGNSKRISTILEGREEVDLYVFPECSLCGYPQQDLLDYPAFSRRSEEEALKLVKKHPNKNFIFGSVEKNRESGRPFRNVAIFARNGEVYFKYFKRLLPSYDVFDEGRFFEPGRQPGLVEFMGEKLSITICEDVWKNDFVGENLKSRYHQDPLEDSKEASLLVNLSASPFEYPKVKQKREMLIGIAKKSGTPLLYTNSVGANDSLIFDGRSYFINGSGELVASAKAFQEENLTVDTSQQGSRSHEIHLRDSEIEDIYDALTTGIQDYCRKSNFSSAIIGLSGGIDSAVLACLASDAIGADNVTLTMLPSRYTSQESNEDAVKIAVSMQNPLHIVSIEQMFEASLKSLQMAFEGLEPDITEENLQSRIRGNVLMAMSNKFGSLLLTTGNKSELAVGYATLYGDMNGGLAPLSDVYKGQVYELGREANRRKDRIPERVFKRPPTAELREDQTDQDSLPAYEVLDRLLKSILEDFKSREELFTDGHPEEIVEQVYALIARNEFKRYQMPLGLKVSSKAFGIGRRVPLVHKFSN